MQENEEWNMIHETKGHESDVPVKTPSDDQSHAYTFDEDGKTVEDLWSSMSYPELRQVCSLFYLPFKRFARVPKTAN